MRRLADTRTIQEAAMRNVKEISRRELWLMGIVLYRARGVEETESRTGLGVRFSSSDPFLVKLFLAWLVRIGKIRRKDIACDLYLHEGRKNMQAEILEYWSRSTGFPRRHFSHVYFFRNNLKEKKPRRKTRYGLVRVRVAASTLLSRQISGWIRGVEGILGKTSSGAQGSGRSILQTETMARGK